MSNIISITGMSGSGKCTISRGVAEHFPKRCTWMSINLRWLQGDAYTEHWDLFGARIFAAVGDLKPREPLVRLGS